MEPADLARGLDTNILSITKVLWVFLVVLGVFTLLSSCSSAAPIPTAAPAAPAEPAATEAPVEGPGSAISPPAQEQLPAPTSTVIAAPTAEYPIKPTAPPSFPPTIPPSPVQSEARIAELEWPPILRLGESDVIRLTLIPSTDGYIATTEFPGHQTQSQNIRLPRPGGYDLYAAARLDGVRFVISPSGEQEQYLPVDEPTEWRWSLSAQDPGRQRLTVVLLLRWRPTGAPAFEPPSREVVAYSRALDIKVMSYFGLSQSQAMLGGLFGLILGGSLLLIGISLHPARRLEPGGNFQPSTNHLVRTSPNLELTLEIRPGILLAPAEKTLFQALFSRYARVVIKEEFLSGYSGARTFLALPIHPDGRTDAHSIVKLGEQEAMLREYKNYETYVKDTLPPVTARIQHPPVTVSAKESISKSSRLGLQKAAMKFTFIGASGTIPRSLRQELLEKPDPTWLSKLFKTFGPNWWMQHKPYTFSLAQEYDRMLPTHLVIEPAKESGFALQPDTSPLTLSLELGDRVSLPDFSSGRWSKELRQDGQSWSFTGKSTNGEPALRLRWLSAEIPASPCGKISATRMDLLRSFIPSSTDLFGFPDPLAKLPALLTEIVQGTQSTIHGDLNLENILVGPGGMVWLIDFAQTRDGHTLFDFAHLEAEIIAHVIASQISSSQDYLNLLERTWQIWEYPTAPQSDSFLGLLQSLHNIASRCLFNPTNPREYYLALITACLGALKYKNLNENARQMLYLTAAFVMSKLD